MFQKKKKNLKMYVVLIKNFNTTIEILLLISAHYNTKYD